MPVPSGISANNQKPGAKQPVSAAEKSATKLGNSVIDNGVTKDITQAGKRKLPSTAIPPGGSRLVAPPMLSQFRSTEAGPTEP